jgi:hypothetical protein
MAAQIPWWGKTLRVIGIVLMSLTAAFTLLGGIGTTCVALNPAGFGGKFSGIAPFQWLYILFVIVTTAIGAWAVRVVVQLVRGEKGSYRRALIVLAAGILVGCIRRRLARCGSSMPVDMVVYTTMLTLVVFLLFRLPGVWQKVGLERGDGGGKMGKAAAAFALAATGLLTLTVQFLMAPTHSIGGINYADVWHATLSVLGSVQLLAAGMLVRQRPACAGPARRIAARRSGRRSLRLVKWNGV